MEKLSLDEIVQFNWADFHPNAKQNRKFLSMLLNNATNIRSSLILCLEDKEVMDSLTDEYKFSMRAIFHVMGQWCIAIPPILIEMDKVRT